MVLLRWIWGLMMADWTSPCGRLAGGLGWSSRQATTRVAVEVPSFSGIRERLLGAPNRFACRTTEEPSSHACQGPNGTLAAAYITSQWLNRELSPSRLSIKTPPFQPPEPLPPFRNLQPASRVDTPNQPTPPVSVARRARNICPAATKPLHLEPFLCRQSSSTRPSHELPSTLQPTSASGAWTPSLRKLPHRRHAHFPAPAPQHPPRRNKLLHWTFIRTG